METETKCSCAHCSEHIAFDPQYAGRTADCPHCGMETKLYIPPVTAKVPVSRARTTATVDYTGIAVAGWICAFLIPIVGLFIGVYLLSKKESGRGVAIMATSVIVGFIVLALMLSS